MEPIQPDDPQRIGPYEVRTRLGSGGMGRVYLGVSFSGRLVAVKVIHPELAADFGFRTRFKREVSAARAVGGAFTAAVIAADPDAEVPWIATEYVPGPSLGELVKRRGPLGVPEVVALAAGLAEGLAAVHRSGVVHRDLKPSNVLIAADGPRIIDFGIAASVGATALTKTGHLLGTPAFMSPEQVWDRDVGAASDIFSLGGVLTYAARGEGPFGTGDYASLLYRVSRGRPDTSGLPGTLLRLITPCLAREPGGRPTATEFLAAVSARDLQGPVLFDWQPVIGESPPSPATEPVTVAAIRPGRAAGEPASVVVTPHPREPGGVAMDGGAGDQGGVRGVRRLWRPAVSWPVVTVAVLLAGTITPALLDDNTPPQAASGGTASAQATLQASAPAVAGGRLINFEDYLPGDCLVGNFGFASQSSNPPPWPDVSTLVPCAAPHTAEVYYVNQYYWPAGEPYPGQSAVISQSETACAAEFKAYDGLAERYSIHDYTPVPPYPPSDWADGERGLYCVAYNTNDPNGTTMRGSIKGTDT